MPAHLTPAEAKALGIDVPGARAGSNRTTRKAVASKLSSNTRCRTCGEVFVTNAAEDRHFVETQHAVYESVDK